MILYILNFAACCYERRAVEITVRAYAYAKIAYNTLDYTYVFLKREYAYDTYMGVHIIFSRVGKLGVWGWSPGGGLGSKLPEADLRL